MKFLAFGTLGMAVLVTGCMTPQEREAAKPGAAITQAEGVKASLRNSNGALSKR